MAIGIDNAIKAGTTIGSGLIGLYGAKKQREFEQSEAEKQRQWNENMADKQNAWNYEMWMKQNEYNSPVEQVNRLREAGLNPLYYGLDGSSAGEITAAQPLGYDRASVAGMANPIQAGIDAAVKAAQIENIQADTAKKGEETLSEVKRREQMSQQIENAKQELENMKSQKGLTDAQKSEIEKRTGWLDRINEAQIAKTEAETALSKSQKKRIDDLLEGEKLLQSKTLEDFEYKWKKIKAECGLIAKQSGIAQLDIENYALNHASNGFMGTGLSVQNFIRMIKGKPIVSQNPTDSDVATADAMTNIVDNKY